jgi:Sulfotransferase family
MSTEHAARAAASSPGRTPDFFIVGHHKSGTTAMYQMLRRHPQIFMPDMKEPEFFREDRLRRRDAPAMSSRRRARTYMETRPQTYAEYLSLFEPAAPDQRVGEASPSYLFSAASARLIAEVQPAARIIAILREPASFLYSLHLQMVRDRVQFEHDFGRAIAGEGVARRGRRALQYTSRICYVEQLRRYHDAFAREQILVVIYDDFRADNQATVRTALNFLAVDPDPATPIEAVDANPTIAPRSRVFAEGFHSLKEANGPVSRGVKATIKAFMPNRVWRNAESAFRRNVVYGSAPLPDERLVIELRRRFKPEVVALSEYLGRDLVSLWGYDGID